MPATYAHYRFGQLALSGLPEAEQRTVQRFRQLFDVGLHGPDLFFYDRALFHTRMGSLGYVYHGMTGADFFEAGAQLLREHPSEGGLAYLLGVLGHFALDAACHPIVTAAADSGAVGHTELETEFDRCLLAADGEREPHLRNVSGHIRLTWGECQTAAAFYPPATVYTIRRNVAAMRLVNRTQSLHNRQLVEAIFRLGHSQDMVMYSRPNRKCSSLIPALEEGFRRALAVYPAMAQELLDCIRQGTALGQYFQKTFC